MKFSENKLMNLLFFCKLEGYYDLLFVGKRLVLTH
ncbi:hypothetical protein M081_3221, partial [Bacteroides fragilis str. 3998 T(B) 4]